MAAHLEISNLVKRYGPTAALNGVDLKVEPGELKVLLGPSGSGKSTILKTVAGFVTPTSGRILLGGVEITHIPIHKRKIGLVMQGYSLFPHMTAYENVAFPLRTQVHRCKRQELRDRVARIFDLVRLNGFETQLPSELSGGQQQRVALARALVFNPEVLLLDEPLAALDRELRQGMQEEIRRLHKVLGMTVIYVTHDQSEAMTVADRIAVINRGQLAQEGTARNLYELPNSEFVARFLGGANILTGTITSIQNNVCTVEVGGLELRAMSDASLRPDSEVALMVRPERVLVGSHEDDHNRLPGTIVDLTYLGSAMQTVIRFDNGTTWRSHVTPATTPMQLGTATWVHWRISDTRIILPNPSSTFSVLEEPV